MLLLLQKLKVAAQRYVIASATSNPLNGNYIHYAQAQQPACDGLKKKVWVILFSLIVDVLIGTGSLYGHFLPQTFCAN